MVDLGLRGNKRMGLRVLSLFDGIACGLQALKNCGIPVDVYYASEIDKHAIACATTNNPEIIEIGDVTLIDFNDYVGKVDLIIGGSPCQGFSMCGKKLEFQDPRSALIQFFFDAVSMIKPRFFMLENVVMRNVCMDEISSRLGITGRKINGALLSYTQRIRTYWTNIPILPIKQVKDKCIVNAIRTYGDNLLNNTYPVGLLHMDKEPLNAPVDTCYAVAHTGDKANQSTIIYDAWGKMNTIAESSRPARIWYNNKIWRLTSEGAEVMHGLPLGYTQCVGDGGGNVRIPLIGNGWCIPVIEHIFKGLKEEVL